MPNLVFVCTGNICRSPFAERLTARMFEERGITDWTVRSLGTNALSGHPMDSLMAAQLEARGGSAAGFQARQASPDRLVSADLLLALSASHREWILEESPALLSRTFTLGQAVRFTQEHAGDTAGEEFLALLRRHRSRARRRDDVVDPYRQGPDAADQAAAKITALLEVLVPRLSPRA